MPPKGVPLTPEHKARVADALRGRMFSEEHKKNLSEARRGKYLGRDNPNWRGGKSVRPDGYVLLSGYHGHPDAINGLVLEHRIVAEKKLERLLTIGEVVHHLDGNPGNNHPDNIVVLESQALHTKAHPRERDELGRLI